MQKALIIDDTKQLTKVIVTGEYAEMYFNDYEKHRLDPIKLRELIDDLITVAGKLPVPKPTDEVKEPETNDQPINLDNIPF